ncbi:hypothetical protein HOY80DRAFT_1135946 [Tuber brumale]|nr:hypothetical protein HOY80DRAFT_1135946 [Tuber brumale]
MSIPVNRSLPRNVSFYDAAHPDVALGGLVQNGSITEANFLDILGILLVVKGSPLRVQGRISSHVVSRTDVPLEMGVYDIYCDSSIQVSNEPWIPRLISHEIASGEHSFRNNIRNRDRKCVISGISNPEISMQANNWTTFEAAYIFPPEQLLEPLDSARLWAMDHRHGRYHPSLQD